MDLGGAHLPGDGAGYGGGRSGGSTSRTRAPFSCCSAGSEYRLGLVRAGVETTWMRLVIGRIAASLPAGTGWRAYRGSSDLARRNDEPTQTLAIDVPGLSNVGFRIFHHPNDLYLVGQRMKRGVRSTFLGIRASARFGRACKLRDSGKKQEALKVAREALAVLGHPDVIRHNAAEGSVLSCSTILVEELADELNATGADFRDVVDALCYIRAVGPKGEFADWIPYLEHKAAQGPADAA